MSLIQVSNLTFGYEGSFDNVFENASFSIDTNWRCGFIGRNGRGKTTFLNLLLGKYAYSGTISASVNFEYFPFEVENPDDTPLEIAESIMPDFEMWRLTRELNLLDADPGLLYRPYSTLSYGERTKVLLSILFIRENSFLLIDEPTNHLDIASREWIEEAVESYDGTLLFVSHDRYFINRFATRVWELEGGVITDYPMGFARYRQVKALEAQNKIDHTPKTVKEKTVTEKPKPNRSAQQARRQLTICEKEISAQETAIAEIEQRLEEAGGDYERYSEIYKEKEAAEQKLGELMEKWETLAEQAGE